MAGQGIGGAAARRGWLRGSPGELGSEAPGSRRLGSSGCWFRALAGDRVQESRGAAALRASHLSDVGSGRAASRGLTSAHRAWVPAREGDPGSPQTPPIFLLVEVLPPEAGRFAKAGPWLCGFEFAYCAAVSLCWAESRILSLASCVLPGARHRKEARTSFIFKKKHIRILKQIPLYIDMLVEPEGAAFPTLERHRYGGAPGELRAQIPWGEPGWAS